MGKTPICYIGGKSYIKDWVVSHFDYGKVCYVELFGGGGSILLAKEPHKVEIFNDIDSLLINFYKILRDDGDRLAEEVGKIPYSRKIYNEFKNSDWESLDDFEKAIRWFCINRMSFSGNFGSGWSYGFIDNQAKHFYNSINLFGWVRERIKNVQIECRDYREIIKSIKKDKEKEIMIYADPPYINANYYKKHWSLDDHKEFAEIMNSLEGSIAISYYETPEIKAWYPKKKWNYHYKEVTKHSKGLTRYSKNTKQRPKAVELLLTNY